MLFLGKFRQFDHGLVGNLFKYGQITPPEYDTSKITAPVALFFSEADSKAAIVVSLPFEAFLRAK